MIDAICREIDLQKDYLSSKPLATVYLGGGTPSIIDDKDLNKIFKTIYHNFDIEDKAEITIESNPDDITVEKLKSWKTFGINRLSIGTQSFFDEDLIWMNRAHNASQAIDSIKLAQDNGFENITIDLIYGTPTLSSDNWLKNLYQAITLNIPHLSCYALTVEEKTALKKFIEKGKIPDIDNELQAKQLELLMKVSNDAGYEQYEISNFAKPGFKSKHNSNYWTGNPYLGIGPSAHSFDGNARQWNVSNNALYIKSIEKKEIPFEKEILSDENKADEYIMTSLRTSGGLDLQHAVLQVQNFNNRIAERAVRWIETKHLVREKAILRLTTKGKLLADAIAADLFL